MTGIYTKVLSAGNASTPPNRKLDGECGAGMVTSMDGGLENPSGTMGRVVLARRSLGEFKTDDKGAAPLSGRWAGRPYRLPWARAGAGAP
jgi:hypothetical protein